jgi:hypothetical protein
MKIKKLKGKKQKSGEKIKGGIREKKTKKKKGQNTKQCLTC